MIHEIDESLRALVRRDVVQGAEVEVVFDAPTKDWSSRRNTPTIDIYLYDIREDLRRRQYGIIDVKDGEGHTVARRQPARFFKLSYLVTAWTQRPEDEHRLLSGLMACFLRHDYIPEDVLVGPLAEEVVPFGITLAIPPPEDRALSDVWSALGGELKPSLDLVVITPMDLDRAAATAAPVTEEPRFGFTRPDGSGEEVQAGAGAGDGSGGEDTPAGDGEQVAETFSRVAPGAPGRVFHIRRPPPPRK
jgi:hypothetical protein